MSEIALRDYIEKLIAHEREQREMQFRESERAINLAKETIDHRLSGMNQLREQISAERGIYVSREIFDRAFAAFEERIRSVEGFKSNLEGRLWIIGGILLVIQIAALFWLNK